MRTTRPTYVKKYSLSSHPSLSTSKSAQVLKGSVEVETVPLQSCLQDCPMELKTDPFTSKLDSRLGQLIYQQTGLTLERNHLHAPGAEVVEVKPALQRENVSEAIAPL